MTARTLPAVGTVVVLGHWLGVITHVADYRGFAPAEELGFATLATVACPSVHPLGEALGAGPWTEDEWRPATAEDVAAVHPSQLEWFRDVHGLDVAAALAGGR